MNPFDRFAPFIREYIYRARWEALRDFQAETAAALFDTPNHVLVMSGTASGKTEAAFLPILTAMHDDPPRSIGAMYVGPLKALINDQFERLSGLLSESGIPLQSWHGDVSQSRKERFLIEPRGVLQITPESLEAMLINRHGDIPRLFADLRYVVVDELHAFIASDRGRQLLCQLDRIARHIGKVPRRVGLSATLGDPDAAAEWLRGGTETPVTLVKDTPGARTIEIGVEHYGQQDYFADLADMTREGQKTLLFANARATAEEIAVAMHRIAEEQQLPDIYYVHHGAVAAEVRQEAEAAMRDPERAACTIATMTLELGIDLGRLDQVLQVGAPNTVSSFVQRLGRSGRRGTPSRMFFFTREKEPDKEPQQPDDPPAEPDQPEGDPQVESHTDETQLDENFEALESLAIPETPIKLEQRVAWDLLQTIAAIQLYVEERWIEPATTPQLPVSLLYQHPCPHGTHAAAVGGTHSDACPVRWRVSGRLPRTAPALAGS
jgi:ATP-dependent helicase Lhr and Lhr-like helicase